MPSAPPSPANGHYRGTIIVDASVLMKLCSHVGNTLRGDGIHPEQYLSILEFLADHGYRVLIPEMVAVEAGDMLANGFDIDALFDTSKHKPLHKELSGFLKDAALPKDAPNKRHPNISIVMNTGPKEVDDFCATLRTAASTDDPVHARHRVMDTRENVNTKDWGDRAILSLMRNSPDINGKHDVFVLTDDGGLGERVRKEQPHAGWVSDHHLIHIVAASEIGEHMGFAKADAETMYRDMQAYHTKKTHQQQLFTPLSAQQIAAIESGQFYLRMRQLKHELAAQQPAPPPAPAASNGASPAMAKFAARYGSLGRINTKSGGDGTPGGGGPG